MEPKAQWRPEERDSPLREVHRKSAIATERAVFVARVVKYEGGAGNGGSTVALPNCTASPDSQYIMLLVRRGAVLLTFLYTNAWYSTNTTGIKQSVGNAIHGTLSIHGFSVLKS